MHSVTLQFTALFCTLSAHQPLSHRAQSVHLAHSCLEAKGVLSHILQLCLTKKSPKDGQVYCVLNYLSSVSTYIRPVFLLQWPCHSAVLVPELVEKALTVVSAARRIVC